MMTALVSTFVAPSLWFQSGLPMNCLQLYACYLNVSVRVGSVWVLQSAPLFRSVLGNQKNCAVWDIYVCLCPGRPASFGHYGLFKATGPHHGMLLP